MTLRARDLLELRGNPLQLESLTGEVGLDRRLPDSEMASPGLVLAGYTARFLPDRMHVLGETEITYLNSLDRRRTGCSGCATSSRFRCRWCSSPRDWKCRPR